MDPQAVAPEVRAAVAAPSATAAGAALLRAAHRVFDAGPPVLDDPYALTLGGLEDVAAFRVRIGHLQADIAARSDPVFAAGLLRGLRAAVVLRNRYAEDVLAAAYARGVRQYVLLGAGLDSFAMRRGAAFAGLEVFELDRAPTLTWKRERLRALGPLPPGLHFVPADLERQSPLDALTTSAFRRDEPACFAWLGVTSYLSAAAVRQTLSHLAGAAAGSELVFSYALAASRLSTDAHRMSAVLQRRIADDGEPAASRGFDPQVLATVMSELGYVDIEDFTIADAERRYFGGRADGLRPAPLTHLMRARVASPRLGSEC